MKLWAAMGGRFGRAWLVCLLLLAQLHFCEASFVRPTGDACRECATITDHAGTREQWAEDHGDCHDCCEIRECKTPNSVDSHAPAPQVPLESPALPAETIVAVWGEVFDGGHEFSYFAGAPPPGAPIFDSSRGPPCSTVSRCPLDARVMSLA